jgi:peptidoglycan/LPS O-acetylase OafA/YrhL
MDAVNGLSDLALWSLIVGFISPWLIAVIQQPGWSKGLRSVVTFVWCIVAAGVTALLQGDLGVRSLLSAILLVFAMTLVTYQGLAKNAGAKTIEAKTSSGIVS